MNILVLNGSPKGNYSITLQTINYLQLLYPNIHFDIMHVAQQIKGIEKDFTNSRIKLEQADIILFSYPVYTFIAPSQLHRFIELMKEHKVNVKDKFATQLTTSKHFYDVTAHRYIQDNCQDMQMKFIKGLSADMDDLLTDKGQKEAKNFLEYILWCYNNNVYEPLPTYESKKVITTTLGTFKQKTSVKEIAIVTDLEENDVELKNMITRFQNTCDYPTTIINLRDIRIDGGCLGCFNCAVSGKCIYKDKFDDYLRNEIQTKEAIVYAFTIKDHSMGSLMKKYDDRQFCNGHRTVTTGMPYGYLINGTYSQEFNLQMIVEGRAEVGGNFLAGIATNEYNPDNEIDNLAKRLTYALENQYTQPANFYGVGGMKIFRDLIYLMQGMMKADHKFYKEHGIYDFPQKKKGTLIAMYLVGFLMNLPMKNKKGNMMMDGMMMPYKKLFEKLERSSN